MKLFFRSYSLVSTIEKKILGYSRSLERIGLDFDERKDRRTLLSFSPSSFRRSKKTLGNPLKRIRDQISTRGRSRSPCFVLTPLFRSHPLVSTIEKNPSRFEIPRKNQIIISTREKIDEALLSFSPPRFDDRKKTLGNSKSPRKNQRLDFDERKDR